MKLHTTEVYLAIESIRRRKESAGVRPTYTLRVADLFKELKQCSTDEIDKALRELLNAGRIEAGRTINDVWVATK